MKTPIKLLITGLILLALATLNFQFSTAFAQTPRIGVITATYTMECSGSGSLDYFDENNDGEIEEDNLSVSESGSAQYEVLQYGTNLFLGNLITSTLQMDLSGGGSEYYIYSDGYIETSSWSWQPGLSYQPEPQTNSLGLYIEMIPIESAARCVPRVSVGDVSGDFRPNNTVGASAVYDTCFATWVNFYFTNSASPWSLTLSATGGVTNEQDASVVSDSASEVLTVSLQYVPDQLTGPFTADQTNGLVPLTVHFSAASVDSAANTIASWNWNFGDGTNGTGQYPAHTYTTNGTFSVTLVATNVNGTTVQGIGASNITVSLPTVQFTVWPTNGVTPLTVNFICPAVDSGDNSIVSWKWDFGDNTSFADQSPHQPVSVNHIYTQIKTFSPKLTVTNVWGTQITTNGPKVFVSPPPIFFTASPTNSLVPMRVQFDGPGVDSQGYAITNWNWYFGDGSTGSGQNPAHTYTKAGIFSPALVVMNNRGAGIVAFGPKIWAGCSEVYGFGGGGAGYDPASGGTTNSDGIHPQAALTVSGNRLYGVMSGGGNGGSGTIFAVNTDASGFTNLYNFSAPPMMYYTNGDGEWPRARLVLSGNTLYGAASSGGTGGGTSFMGEGTLFKINTDGSGFATLFNFPDGSDGGTMPNGLVLSSNTLYGTTGSGGNAYNGTVFKIATDGSGFTRIHDFSASAYDSSSGSQTNGDGASPQAALVFSADTLYGTASRGGSGGGGTVFKLGTNGLGFAVLHNFTNSDGSVPSAELMLSGGMLYGTTGAGGSGNDGTVFKIGTNGAGFSTLHVFPATVSDGAGNYTNSDGAEPYGGLILSGSMLFGTTESGGSGGSGTIFAINMDGSGFTNLYSFSALDSNTNFDGANPYAGLALSGNTVYATAFNGGCAGDGALFALSLAVAPPWLDIQPNGNALVISWLSSATGYSLQQSTNLSTTNWTAFGGTVSSNGTTMSVTNSSPTGNLFFRLTQP
jgi:uncharacterized repeat protein (TIGR03803 family)